MSIQYIRDYYKVPARVGARVMAYGKPGTITGTSGAHLLIRIDGAKHALPHHPTDQIEYLSEQECPLRPNASSDRRE